MTDGPKASSGEVATETLKDKQAAKEQKGLRFVTMRKINACAVDAHDTFNAAVETAKREGKEIETFLHNGFEYLYVEKE